MSNLKKIISKNKKNKTPYVIAEIGAKYGDIKLIKKMILELKKLKVDAIKFQTFKASNLVDHRSVFYPNN